MTTINVTPRAYTEEEVREQLYRHLRSLALYWSDPSVLGNNPTEYDRMMGLIHSMLSMFDGCTMNLPRMEIRLDPHPSDEPYLKNEGSNWYESGMKINRVMMNDEIFHVLAKTKLPKVIGYSDEHNQ